MNQYEDFGSAVGAGSGVTCAFMLPAYLVTHSVSGEETVFKLRYTLHATCNLYGMSESELIVACSIFPFTETVGCFWHDWSPLSLSLSYLGDSFTRSRFLNVRAMDLEIMGIDGRYGTSRCVTTR